MLSPSYTRRAFKAQHVFTDREEPRTTFIKTISKKLDHKDYSVLNYYGFGGIGKTALCEQFTKVLENDKNKFLSWAKLDFNNPLYHTPEEALITIRLQLAKKSKIPFPAFDAAFARYFSFARPGQNIHDSYPELFTQPDDILQDLESFLGDLIEEVPGAGLIYKYIKKLKTGTQDWWNRRGKDILQDLDTLEQHKILEKLPTYMGSDIYSWLFDNNTNEKKQNHKVVIFIDTYEALWRNLSVKMDKDGTLVDTWVRKLVVESPGVLFVILGRDKLNWGVDWKSAIEFHLLGGLSPADADAFLKAVPINELKVRQAIISGAEGIPFYLDLQVDLYESLKQEKQKPHASNFGSGHKEIIPRFVDHLDSQSRRTLQLLAHARYIDERLVRSIAKEFIGGSAGINFKDIITYSFWRKEDNYFLMHSLLNKYLLNQSKKYEPELFNDIHAFIFEYYNKILSTDEGWTRDNIAAYKYAVSEAFYHLKFLSSNRLYDFIFNIEEIISKEHNYAFSFSHHLEIWQLAIIESKKEYGENHQHTFELQWLYAKFLSEIYKDEEAVLKYKELLSNSFFIKDTDNYLITKVFCGLSEYRSFNYLEALNIFKEVETFTEENRNAKLDGLNFILGKTFVHNQDFRNAEVYLEKALNTIESCSSDSLGSFSQRNLVDTLNDLAKSYKANGKQKEAILMWERSLELSLGFFGEVLHLHIEDALHSLVSAYEEDKEYNKAESLINLHISIVKKLDTPALVSIGEVLLADCYALQGKYFRAHHLYEKAIDVFGKHQENSTIKEQLKKCIVKYENNEKLLKEMGSTR